MDPRKNWLREALLKKRKIKRRKPPKTIHLPANFWDQVAQRRSYLNDRKTEIYDNDLEFRISELVRKTRGVRERNENFRDEINEIMGIDIAHGAHNRQSRINRGNQIIRQIHHNDAILDDLQIEMDTLTEFFDDVTSNPRN